MQVDLLKANPNINVQTTLEDFHPDYKLKKDITGGKNSRVLFKFCAVFVICYYFPYFSILIYDVLSHG